MIKLIYNDGSVRTIQEHPNFYSVDVRDRGISVRDKVRSLACDLGGLDRLYKAELVRGDKVIDQIKNAANEPNSGNYEEPKVDQKELVKKIKKQLSNKEFTMKLAETSKGRYEWIELKTGKILNP